MVGWKIALWVLVVGIAVWFLYLVRSILLPFVLAFIISALLDPSIKKLRMRGYKRGTAVAIVFFAFFGLVGVVGYFVFPIIGAQLTYFKDSLQAFTNQLSQENPNENYFVKWNPAVRAQPAGGPTAQVDKVIEQLAPTLDRLGLPSTRQALITAYVEPHRAEIANTVEHFFSGFLGIIGTAFSQIVLLLFTPLFVYFMLIDLEKFKMRGASWIPPSIRAETLSIIREIGEVFVKYLRGVTLTIIAYMAVMAIVLSILGAPYSVLLAILFGALYIIPMVGPLINALTLFLVTGLSGTTGNMLFDLGSSWGFAILVTVLYLGCSTLFDQLVYPNMVGRAVGLHPLVSMFVVFSGAALFGLVGMILAFPLAGSVKVILERLLKVTSSAHSGDLNLPVVPLRHRTAAEV
jgi:predicted PurR-regulated permease PerM